jgi:hypothetical protein
MRIAMKTPVLSSLTLAFTALWPVGAARAADLDPVLVGRWPSGEARIVHDVAVHGDHAYWATNSGLVIFDISDPARGLFEREVGIHESGSLGQVYVAGGHAYVAGDDVGLEVIDVSDPASPQPRGRYEGGAGRRFFVSGEYVYGANGRTLDIIDVSDPSRPQLVGRSATGNAMDVFVSGSVAFVADQRDGLWVIDVTNAAALRRVARYSDGIGFTLGVFVSEEYAYVTSLQGEGLVVLDVSDPSNPRRIGGWGLAIGGRILVANGRAYLHSRGLVLDVSDPATPRPIARLPNGFVIVCSKSCDLRVVFL